MRSLNFDDSVFFIFTSQDTKTAVRILSNTEASRAVVIAELFIRSK